MNYADTRCTYHEVTAPEHGYVFNGPCVVTGKTQVVFVKSKELYAYRQGAYIQDALKSLNADQREFLMTGISKEGWDLTFKDEDDEPEPNPDDIAREALRVSLGIVDESKGGARRANNEDFAKQSAKTLGIDSGKQD